MICGGPISETPISTAPSVSVVQVFQAAWAVVNSYLGLGT